MNEEYLREKLSRSGRDGSPTSNADLEESLRRILESEGEQ